VLGARGSIGVRVATRLQGWNVTVVGTLPFAFESSSVEGVTVLARMGSLNSTVMTGTLETFELPAAGDREVTAVVWAGPPWPWMQLGMMSAAAARPSALRAAQAAFLPWGCVDMRSLLAPAVRASRAPSKVMKRAARISYAEVERVGGNGGSRPILQCRLRG
jgi:hypothetical protein